MKIVLFYFIITLISTFFPGLLKAQEDSIVVGIFRDKKFEGKEIPASLRPESFEKYWSGNPRVKIVYLDANQIRYFSTIFKNQMDILVFPYGGYYPMESFGYYSGQSFNYFLRKGGAVLTTGEIPFSKQTNANGNLIGKYDSLQPDKDVYDKWIARFGVEYYITPFTPSTCIVNKDFLPAATALPTSIQPGRIGIVSNNSSHEPVPKPSNGNVFPERYPARQVIPILQGADQFGEVINNSALLVQDFQNGSRQILIANTAEPHLLSPSKDLPAIMSQLLNLLTNKVIAKDVECSYACYKQGEEVAIKTEIISFEKKPVDIEVKLEIINSLKKTVHTETKKTTIVNGNTLVKRWFWKPASFDDDEYTFRMRIYRDNALVSETENGFVVWNDSVIQKGPAISIGNEYFKVGDKNERFISGTNYYESTRGEIMWFRPNVKNITRDIREMKRSGINYIRPHYHHLKWFKDYLLYHHNKLFEFYAELEKIEDPLPDERAWRIWDMFIYLTQKYGIVYGGDLFTLVPEEMGDPRGWWGTTETVYTKSGRAVQKDFLVQLSRRYAAVKGISWDLFNEPFEIDNKDIESWAEDLKKTLADNNLQRLISIGGSHGISKKIIDYETPHGIPPANEYNLSGIPSLMQELHIDRKESFDDEKDQAETLREQFIVVIRNGYAGICPWSWTRQMRLWQDSYEHHYSFQMEKWDDRLGLHMHDDGTYKMAGRIFRDMSVLMKKISLNYFDTASRKVFSDIGQVIADFNKGSGYIYHINKDQCYAAMSRDSIAWGGKVLLRGPSGGYVYLYNDELKNIPEAKQLMMKSEQQGELLLTARKKNPKKIYLVDMEGDKQIFLKELKSLSTPEGIKINVEQEFVNYWIKVIW